MILHPAFEPLKAAFDQAFEDGLELGARFCVMREGEVLADLWGRYADRDRVNAFTARTLTPVFSVTKILAAVLIARLVDAGGLAYGQTVASVWPEFAAEGKGEITIEQVMSHQAGLSGFIAPMDPADWFDWDLITARLAAASPLFAPGSASGYHPVTYGYLAGEIFRRVDGRSMGRALREDLAVPLGLDLHIGLTPEDDARTASLERPKHLPRFGVMNEALRAAFLTKWASPGGRGQEVWRRAEIPSANGHATAGALAALMSRLALGGEGVMSRAGVEAMTRRRIRGRDLVLPFDISWGAGVMRNEGLNIYGSQSGSFGHSGWGGACAFADPEAGVAMAYVMNRQSAELLGDPRPLRLIEAAYAGLEALR